MIEYRFAISVKLDNAATRRPVLNDLEGYWRTLGRPDSDPEGYRTRLVQTDIEEYLNQMLDQRIYTSADVVAAMEIMPEEAPT